MESRNVKVIDEHSIDRTANIICSIDVDGTDYVIYWIERDSDNDNLFVSKLVKNNDGTSNMVNIEDNMEKGKISDIVKELITYSINNEASTLATDSVTLTSGKKVGISSVLFNKEQNINVGKTYITTVKKSVTKVSEDFYKVEGSTDPFSGATPQTIFEPVKEAAMPEIGTPNTNNVAHNVNTAQEIMNSFIEPQKEAESIIEVPKVDVPVMPEVSLAPTPEIPTIEATIPTEPIITASQPVPTPVAPIQSSEVDVTARVNIIDGSATEQTPAPTSMPVSEASVVTEIKPEPVVPPITPEVAPSVVPETNKLVFDGSKETNLNIALGEVSIETSIPVNNVEPIREFGQDEPAVSSSVVPSSDVNTTSGETTPVQPQAGFANNKFFMVIAIAFFIASCIFLGYEVYRYFQIK